MSQEQKLKVLLVEDDLAFLEVVKIYMHDRFDIVTALNAEETFEVLEKNPPDVVVLDVMMPKTDGFSICKTIKNSLRHQHIPVILLTAKSTQKDMEEGKQSGADFYITKPFDFDELFLAIEKTMKLRHKSTPSS